MLQSSPPGFFIYSFTSYNFLIPILCYTTLDISLIIPYPYPMTTSPALTSHNPIALNPIEQYCTAAYGSDEDVPGNAPQGKHQLAEDANVGWSVVHKTSLGLYSAIPVKLANFMASNPVGDADHSASRWNDIYRAFQQSEMEVLKKDIEEGRMESTALFVQASDLKRVFGTFIEWRESLSYSQMDFCKTFLIHQAILQKYEAGQMKKLPQTVKDKLRYLGMTNDYIIALGALPIKAR